MFINITTIDLTPQSQLERRLPRSSSCGLKPDWLPRFLCRFHLPSLLHLVPSRRQNLRFPKLLLPPATATALQIGEAKTETSRTFKFAPPFSSLTYILLRLQLFCSRYLYIFLRSYKRHRHKATRQQGGNGKHNFISASKLR